MPSSGQGAAKAGVLASCKVSGMAIWQSDDELAWLIAERGHTFDPAYEGRESGTPDDVVARCASDEELRTSIGADDQIAVLLAIVAGGHAMAREADELERAAARLARRYGVTVQQLAAVAGVTERTAHARYRTQ